MLGRLRELVLGICADEAGFDKRGFWTGNVRTRDRLEHAGRSFIQGYGIALYDGRPDWIAEHLEQVEPEFRGFAFEGAAMGFAILDTLSPWRRNRLRAFISGPGSNHVYMAYVGAGWAFARLRFFHRDVNSFLNRFDLLLRWLVLDGYGFHEGYFHWRRSFLEHATPSGVSSYAQRAFDQGLGRSLWFVAGGAPDKINSIVTGFPPTRQPDLWSGLGVACAYAGGTDKDVLDRLRRDADGFLPHVQQGVTFAAKARERAGNPSPHTELACQILCDMSASQAAAVTDQALENLPPDGQEPAYEVWRSRIRNRFSLNGYSFLDKTEADSRSLART